MTSSLDSFTLLGYKTQFRLFESPREDQIWHWLIEKLQNHKFLGSCGRWAAFETASLAFGERLCLHYILRPPCVCARVYVSVCVVGGLVVVSIW